MSVTRAVTKFKLLETGLEFTLDKPVPAGESDARWAIQKLRKLSLNPDPTAVLDGNPLTVSRAMVNESITPIITASMQFKRNTSITALVWVLAGYHWYRLGGPKPASPKRIVIDSSYVVEFKCPLCDEVYEPPKNLKDQGKLLVKYSEWLSQHSKAVYHHGIKTNRRLRHLLSVGVPDKFTEPEVRYVDLEDGSRTIELVWKELGNADIHIG